MIKKVDANSDKVNQLILLSFLCQLKLLNCLTRFTYLEDLEDVCQHSRPVLVVGGEDDPGVAAGVDAGGDVGAAAEGGLGWA